ncbi:MAG: ABC transporter ATP-binding protein [Actinomycetota bacterium]|nr:ABC transporter ATP-binding protein [Actinomycetota bacterium]
MVDSSSLAIATRGLTKTFSGVAAVDHVDLEVPTGAVFGFLGPNGSGKTTTIRILLGLIAPTAGTWQMLGEDMPAAIPRTLPNVGALVEGPAFYPWLSGPDNLARLDAAGPDGRRGTRRARIDEALARVGLSAAGGKKYRAYSLGMRQRLGLAAALLRPRQLLVLDEPTNGMDPQGTREIRHLIRELAADGTTVFLSSHLLTEVEAVCTHAAVMSRGLLLAQGTLESLRASSVVRLRVEVDQPARAVGILTGLGVGQPVVEADTVTGVLGTCTAEECCRALVLADIAVRALGSERPSLEDLFVALTGEGFDVDG